MIATPSKPARVLVVENDRVTRDILVQFLQMSGFEVLSAETGERGLLTLREWRRGIDWLFTAVRLPGLVDGWIVADEYHLHHPDRAVVHACAADQQPGPEVKGSVLVNKPVSPHDILMIIKGLAEAAPVLVAQPAGPMRAGAAG